MSDVEVEVGSSSETTPVQEVDRVNIRFAGDSGDGMQLTGNRFTQETALSGNDLRTFPDYPAEIRAPAGTLAGVSAFQISFSSHAIHTAGDAPDVLVAMNPAALAANLKDLKDGGTLILNSAQFTKRNLEKAGYSANPIEDESLKAYKLHSIDITGMTTKALEDTGLTTKIMDRCKNFFALGVTLWLYNRSFDSTVEWIGKKFGKKPELVEANTKVLKAGYYYGETAEIFDGRFEVKKAPITEGVYRNINGNSSLAMGFVAASMKANRDLFLGSYPITPASTILHELARYKAYGVKTFQAEDEIAAVCAAVGASFGGALAITTTSGPGLALKAEAIGLAVMTELPLVAINVQRGGPSTGLPTKTEQSDLLQGLYGRNGEAPMPVLACASPADAFETAYEAARIALKYMTPVLLLSDGYIANGTEPWKLPDPDKLIPIETFSWTDPETFQPYSRNPETLARPWVTPGTPKMEHRLGGLEKAHLTGGVSYDPHNHEMMIRMRDEKVKRVTEEIPATAIEGGDSGELLIVGWGSTYGVILGAAANLRAQGRKVSCIHLRYLNPLPPDLKEVFSRFDQVVVAEMNLGQLAMILRAETLVDIKKITKVQGQPFKESEIVGKATEIMGGKSTSPFLLKTLENIIEGPLAQAEKPVH
ncbi:MAG: 2-oxoacid:acceptor oxidoreductase subunit alpha [Deltaproteobacteria bacterium]|jgi:2-oxoglutarate/2-oxoacid ferredoxin oxidoreductase subunit alpha|nr:2-oxoacid:acceptor oxidoreductase subunit alpha [Deltaproteobacteria bacterium]MBT6433433.1 2-oxoacid:acceptor oxidoreductase subunit alpha [Deltaproteobacteria bacterium]MBT6489580.1 2-oxoacid:acceptor oxidoreductase subunit alpha [Deltaproteobacteria bacterium]